MSSRSVAASALASSLASRRRLLHLKKVCHSTQRKVFVFFGIQIRFGAGTLLEIIDNGAWWHLASGCVCVPTNAPNAWTFFYRSCRVKEEIAVSGSSCIVVSKTKNINPSTQLSGKLASLVNDSGKGSLRTSERIRSMWWNTNVCPSYIIVRISTAKLTDDRGTDGKMARTILLRDGTKLSRQSSLA